MALSLAPASLSGVSETPKDVVPCSEDAALGIRPCWELEAGRVGVFMPGKGAKTTKGFRPLPKSWKAGRRTSTGVCRARLKGQAHVGVSAHRALTVPSGLCLPLPRTGADGTGRAPVPDTCILPNSSLSRSHCLGPSGSGLLGTRARSIR